MNLEKSQNYQKLGHRHEILHNHSQLYIPSPLVYMEQTCSNYSVSQKSPHRPAAF